MTGKYSTPVLWCKKEGTIVCNESLDILKLLDSAFDPLCAHPERKLFKPAEMPGMVTTMAPETVSAAECLASFGTVENGLAVCASAACVSGPGLPFAQLSFETRAQTRTATRLRPVRACTRAFHRRSPRRWSRRRRRTPTRSRCRRAAALSELCVRKSFGYTLFSARHSIQRFPLSLLMSWFP